MRTSRLLHSNGTILFAVEARRQLESGDARRAIETCKLGLARYPEHAAGYVVLAAAYRALGQEERARRVLVRGFERTGLEQLREQAGRDEDLVEGSAAVEPPSPEQPESPHEEWIGVTEEETAAAAEVVAAPSVEELRAEDAARSEETVSEAPPVEALAPVAPAIAQDAPSVAAESDAAPATPVTSESTVEEAEGEKPAIGIAEPGELEVETARVESRRVETPAMAANVVEKGIADRPSGENPEVEKGEVEMPEADKPGVEKPDLEKPGVGPPAVEKPTVEKPAVEAPEIDRPQLDKPEVEKPQVDKPQVEQPAVDKPEIEKPRQEPAEEAHPVAEPTAGDEDHSPLELVEERSGEPEHDEPIEPARDVARPAPGGGLSIVERQGERVPWFQRRTPRAGERQQGPALALHSGKSAHRLTSANLRLIPGLEFAPLRAEDPARRMTIAPIMEDPLPDWEPRRRTSSVENAPPLPEYPSIGGAQTSPRAPQQELEPQRGAAPDDAWRSTRPGTPAAPNDAAPTGSPEPSSAPVEEQPRPQRRAATTPEIDSLIERIAELPSPVHAERDSDTSAIDELARRLEGARIAPVGEAPPQQRHAFEPSIVSDTLADILVAQGAYGEAMKAFMTLARTRPEKIDYYEERIAEMKRRIREERPDTE